MQTIQLQVEDNLIDEAIDYIKQFVSKHKTNSNYIFIDDI